MCIDHRKTANSNHFPVLHRIPNTCTGHPTQDYGFFGYYCGFLPLIPVGEITIISNDIDMVFY